MRFAALAIIFLVFFVAYSFSDVPAAWKQCTPIGMKTSGDTSPPNQICCVAPGGAQKWVTSSSGCIYDFTVNMLPPVPATPKPSDAITFKAEAKSSQGLKSIRIQLDESFNALDGFVEDRYFLNNACNGATTCTLTGTVPAKTYADKQVIKYRAKAVDNFGGASSSTLDLLISQTTANTPPKIEFLADPVAAWYDNNFAVTITYSDADTQPGQQLESCSYEIVDGGIGKGVTMVACSGNSQSTSVIVSVGTGNLCAAQGADKCIVKASA
ncbi:MAG: hypothetical protein HY365_01825, partial [Candidatus Aenigmarchaeota archaeon]|nr:hypothetical protein [Candidatus Aenigmarchaeota archaeon]